MKIWEEVTLTQMKSSRYQRTILKCRMMMRTFILTWMRLWTFSETSTKREKKELIMLN
jgi:hypothetical protein